MGKHYPGEQLPRWALYSHWRTDGEPVWRDPALLASDDDTDNATAEDADRFARLLAERLQVDPAWSTRPMRTSTTSSGARSACRPTSSPRTPS